ncbi:MAG: MFS transporter [Desulfarculaceae bacterium]|nr:MFS transporter [Desulfarculaceae bacterium]MCF8073239.1 MFS transporter [Desulfarculaceae bacterium]MCF8100835.1 MFS transporter [Desulfarculaceae bacterium]
MVTDTARGQSFYGWWLVGAVGVVGLWAGVIFYGITAFINPIVQDMKWSYLAISLAMSLRSVEMGLFSPLTGYLSDRFGARKVVLLAALTVTAGFFILSRLDSLWTFYAGFIVLSIGLSGMGHSAILTPIANWFSRNLGKAIGLAMIGYGFSGLFIPLIAWLIDLWHWRNVFAVLAAVTLVVLVPAALMIRQRPEDYGQEVDGAHLLPAGADHAVPEHDQAFQGSRYFALRTRAFWMLSLSTGTFAMVLNIVSLYMLPYLEMRQVPTETAALVVMGIPLASVPGRIFMGWLGDVLDKRLAMVVALGLMSLGLALICLWQAVWLYFVFVFLFGMGFGGIFSLRSAVIREYFGRHCFGSVQGMSTPLMVLGGVAGPPIAGWIFDTQSNLDVIWVLCLLVCLASIPMVLAMGSREACRPPEREAQAA